MSDLVSRIISRSPLHIKCMSAVQVAVYSYEKQLLLQTQCDINATSFSLQNAIRGVSLLPYLRLTMKAAPDEKLIPPLLNRYKEITLLHLLPQTRPDSLLS